MKKLKCMFVSMAVFVCGNVVTSGIASAEDEWLNKSMQETGCIGAKNIVDRELKHGLSYKFGVTLNNDGEKTIGVNNVNVHVAERSDFNGSKFFPTFGWTDEFEKLDHKLKSGVSIKGLEATTKYPITYRPSDEHFNDQSPDLLIVYKQKYFVENGSEWNGPFEKVTSCIRYKVMAK